MLFMGQRKNRSSRKTVPVPIQCIKCRLSRYNAPIIAFTYCVTKFFGGSLGALGYRTDQPGLIVDSEGTRSIDEVRACLKRMAIPLNSCATFATQGVVTVEYKDDLHNRVKIGVCHTISSNQTTENGIGVSCAVDVDVASEDTTGHSD